VDIPAIDATISAIFYESVFGWKTRDRDSTRPKFDNAAGTISGAWVIGREAAGNVTGLYQEDVQA
jgi:uncharacterized protein